MLLFAPSRRTYSAISQEGWGRWWISRLMLTTAISVPTSGESVTSPKSGFAICADQFDVVPWHEALEDDLLGDHMFLDDVSAEVFDEVDDRSSCW